jgi:hypothetical protein
MNDGVLEAAIAGATLAAGAAIWLMAGYQASRSNTRFWNDRPLYEKPGVGWADREYASNLGMEKLNHTAFSLPVRLPTLTRKKSAKHLGSASFKR